MAVLLSELVEALEATLNPPGRTLFPDETADGWELRLRNAFWEAKLAGWFAGHREQEGTVKPTTAGAAELSREEQQLIVLYAAYNAVRADLMTANSSFSAQSGRSKFEVQRSANLMVELLRGFRSGIDDLAERIADHKTATPTHFFDAVWARDEALLAGDAHWVR